MKSLLDNQEILSKASLEPASVTSEDRFVHLGAVVMNTAQRLAITGLDYSAQSLHMYLANSGHLRVDGGLTIRDAEFGAQSPHTYLANFRHLRVDGGLTITGAEFGAQSPYTLLANPGHIRADERLTITNSEFGSKSPHTYLANSGHLRADERLPITSSQFGSKSAHMYLANTGHISVADRLGSNCIRVGFQSSGDTHSVSGSYIKMGDVLGATSVDVGYLSSTDMYSANSRNIKLGERHGNTIHSFKPSANLCLASNIGAERTFSNTGAAHGFLSLFDPISARSGINLGETYENTISSFKPSANPYSTSPGRMGVELMVGGTGLVTLGLSNRSQKIAGAIQQSPVIFTSFRSPLSIVQTGEYYDISPLGGLTGNCYAYGARGSKRIRFHLPLPLQFNDGLDVPAEMLEEAKRELLELFGGVSCVTQTGLWKDGGVVYRDIHMRLEVDAPDTENSRRSMQRFKERWRRRLDQVELYMTTSVVEIM